MKAPGHPPHARVQGPSAGLAPQESAGRLAGVTDDEVQPRVPLGARRDRKGLATQGTSGIGPIGLALIYLERATPVASAFPRFRTIPTGPWAGPWLRAVKVIDTPTGPPATVSRPEAGEVM